MATQKGTVRPARLFKELSNSRTRCHSCERKCLISEGKRGFCKTFENRKGKLHTLTYGDISAAESRPMEIKPFFHFHPGQRAVTISSWGCNLTCPWCQNHHISRGEPRLENADQVPPEQIVQYALREGDKGTCVSFGEPTILMDYCLDLFPLAKKKGLFERIVQHIRDERISIQAVPEGPVRLRT
jgi:pyruvate formate lyase activating enzyme